MPRIQHICIIGGGNDVHTRNRTKIFADMGYKVTFITDQPSGLDNVEEIFLQMPANPNLNQFWGTMQFVKAIRKVDADAYLVHFARRNSAWGAAIANVHPLAVSVMGGDVNFDEYGSDLSQFQRDLTLSVLETADVILSQTHYLSDVMQQMNIAENKIDRIIWGIDPQHWHKRSPEDVASLRKQFNISPNDRVLFSPKMLLPFYNIHIIIDALPTVLEQYPQLKVLVSERKEDIDYKKQILSKIDEYGLQDHIIFVGDIPHDQMATYYSLADAVVTLASYDGLPHAMLEAMACEVPYLLGDLERYREFVQHKETVYFVDFNATSVANGIIELLSNTELRTHIIEQAHDLVYQMADINKESQRVIKLLEHIPTNKQHRATIIDMRLFKQFALLGTQQLFKKIFNRH